MENKSGGGDNSHSLFSPRNKYRKRKEGSSTVEQDLNFSVPAPFHFPVLRCGTVGHRYLRPVDNAANFSIDWSTSNDFAHRDQYSGPRVTSKRDHTEERIWGGERGLRIQRRLPYHKNQRSPHYEWKKVVRVVRFVVRCDRRAWCFGKRASECPYTRSVRESYHPSDPVDI
jgi:hypothetical protein